METSAAISVLLPVYNAEKFIAEAIDSILAQTFTNFELLLLNDGSTDGSLAIMESYDDARIRIINYPENLGLITTLNNGIEAAKGEFLARMDADDISVPNRLELQYAFMQKNQDVSVIGGNVQFFGDSEDKTNFELDHKGISLRMCFENPFAHPATMLKKADLVSNKLAYSKEFIHTEDWELWLNCLMNNLKFANLSDVVLNYRVGDQNITAHNQASRKERYFKLYTIVLNYLGVEANTDNLEAHYCLNFGTVSKEQSELIAQYLPDLKKGLETYFDQKKVQEVLEVKYKRVIFKLADSDAKAAKQFMKNIGFKDKKISKYLLSKIVFRK